jgi:hypothetical protein
MSKPPTDEEMKRVIEEFCNPPGEKTLFTLLERWIARFQQLRERFRRKKK